jgi:predicted outer membrane repeat protein
MRRFLPLLLGALSSAPAAAAVRVVPDMVGTIGGALAISAAGDTIVVRPGTYPEHVVLVDGVVLLADDPMDRPVIDGTASGRPISASGCGSGTVVNGFVIRHGFSTAIGGGAMLSASQVVFTECDFLDNTGSIGGAIGAVGSSFTVDGCVFSGNVATQSGGAIGMTDASSPDIGNSSFVANSAFAGGAMAIRNGCTPQITGCLVDGGTADQGAALWYDFLTGGSVTQCTIVNAQATGGSGGVLYLASVSSPVIQRSIVAFGAGGGAIFAVGGATATFGCNCVFGNVGGDAIVGGFDDGTNLSADPRFCDRLGGDYELMDISPCATDMTCPLIGAFPVACTAVASPGPLPESSWGRIKSQWR